MPREFTPEQQAALDAFHEAADGATEAADKAATTQAVLDQATAQIKVDQSAALRTHVQALQLAGQFVDLMVHSDAPPPPPPPTTTTEQITKGNGGTIPTFPPRHEEVNIERRRGPHWSSQCGPRRLVELLGGAVR